MNKSRLLGAVCAFCIYAFQPVNAVSMLDAHHYTPGASGPEVRSDQWLAQTFTVGTNGSLTDVEIWNFLPSQNPPDAPLIVELFGTNGTAPTGAALASVSVLIQDVGTNPITDRTVADFSSFSLSVNANDVLAIVLRTNSTLPGAFDWWGDIDSVNDPYTDGRAHASSDGGSTWGQLPGLSESEYFDFHFWTYVELNPVPIPPTLWLFGSGLLSLIGVARRKT